MPETVVTFYEHIQDTKRVRIFRVNLIEFTKIGKTAAIPIAIGKILA